MIQLIVGLVIFLGVHSAQIVAPSVRLSAIERLGRFGWMAVYSLLSIGGFYLIVNGYSAAQARSGIVYDPLTTAGPLTHILMGIALILIVATYLPLSNLKKTVRHPMITAVILWAIAHLLVNGTTAAVILFGSFLVWAVVDRISIMFRPAPASLQRAPSAIYDVVAIVTGIGLYAAAMLGAHQWLFGVSPIVNG